MMNEQIQFLTPNSYMPPQKRRLEKGERSNTGGVWFVTLLPIIGLFLESFATDKYAGAALWIAVIVLIYFGCIADFRSIRHEVLESQEDRLKMLLVFPPAYLYCRDKMLNSEGYKGLVLAVLIIAAAFANGFTEGLSVNEENLIPLLENAWVTELDNLSGSSENYIGEQLESWFDDGYSSEGSKAGEIFTIVFSGTHEGKPAEVVIKVEFDGFAYQSIYAKSVTIDGERLEGEALRDELAEIFIGEEDEPEEDEIQDEE